MDFRYRRTEKHIIEACIKLAKKKDIYALTVTEIAKEAEINRITFYSHYENINCLIEHLEDKLIEDGLSQMGPFSDFLNNPETFIKRNMDIYHQDMTYIFTKSSKSLYFRQKAMKAIIKKVIEECHIEDEETHKKIVFIENGIYGIFNTYNIDEKTMKQLSNIIKSILQKK